MEGNIYLIGFSGTGKTNTGRRVAELMGWEFFEMDQPVAVLEVNGDGITIQREANDRV